jgi:hypothetical protein
MLGEARFSKMKGIKKAPGEELFKLNSLNYASVVSNGTTDTNERLSFFLRNSTRPSVSANKVWSLPIPTL